MNELPQRIIIARDDGRAPITPVYIRLPRPGQYCSWTGLSRSKMNQLILPTDANGHKSPVASASLNQEGTRRGTRLISLESLLTYIAANVEGGES